MILLTGGGGYVGSHVVASLCAAGDDVKLLRHGERFSALPEGWQLDLADSRQLAQLPALSAAVLIHLGGAIDIRLRSDPADATNPPLPGDASLASLYKANVEATAALADCCVARAIPMIFASSQTVYGIPAGLPVDESASLHPLEPYAASKAAAESMLRLAAQAGLAVTVLRFPGVYGGGRNAGAVYGMAKSALRTGRIRVVADFPLPFDVLHIDDVVDGIIAAVRNPDRGWRVCNLGSGEPCSLVMLAEAIAALVPGCTVEPPQIAQPVVHLATEAALRILSWKARPRAERLSQLIEDVRHEIANAA